MKATIRLPVHPRCNPATANTRLLFNSFLLNGYWGRRTLFTAISVGRFRALLHESWHMC